MTEYQELSAIKKSLMNKINQHSNEEDLLITVQVEEYEFGFDTVVMLFDSSEALLLDETYTENHQSESHAITKANELHACISLWTEDENVYLYEKIKEVSF